MDTFCEIILPTAQPYINTIREKMFIQGINVNRASLLQIKMVDISSWNELIIIASQVVKKSYQTVLASIIIGQMRIPIIDVVHMPLIFIPINLNIKSPALKVVKTNEEVQKEEIQKEEVIKRRNIRKMESSALSKIRRKYEFFISNKKLKSLAPLVHLVKVFPRFDSPSFFSESLIRDVSPIVDSKTSSIVSITSGSPIPAKELRPIFFPRKRMWNETLDDSDFDEEPPIFVPQTYTPSYLDDYEYLEEALNRAECE